MIQLSKKNRFALGFAGVNLVKSFERKKGWAALVPPLRWVYAHDVNVQRLRVCQGLCLEDSVKTI